MITIGATDRLAGRQLVSTVTLQQEEKAMLNMVQLRSSVINSVGYDAKAMVLVVRFNEGAIYRYYYVPEWVYQGFLAAGSPGRFYNFRVKGHYPAEQMQ